MTIKKFSVEKLIRDKLPVFLESKGIIVHTKTLSEQEFNARLKEKLLEETKEVSEASSPEELCEELADVLEVVHSLAKSNGISLKQIEQKRIEKREIKGGFENRVFNSFVSVDNGNSSIHYFLNNPHKYPEIHSGFYQTSCLFCQMAHHEREVEFLENFDHCYVIKDQFPVSNGHLLIIPYEHTQNWFSAKEEVRLDMI